MLAIRAVKQLKPMRRWFSPCAGLLKLLAKQQVRVTKPTRDTYPQIPWGQVIAMRNSLIHAYFDVDLDQVWKAVTEDIPPLIAELEKIIPPEADS